MYTCEVEVIRVWGRMRLLRAGAVQKVLNEEPRIGATHEGTGIIWKGDKKK